MNVSLIILGEIVKDREAWHAAVHGTEESDTTERLNKNEVSTFLRDKINDTKRLRSLLDYSEQGVVIRSRENLKS